MDLIAAAFIAGLITFLLPCTLPVLPVYIGVLATGKTKRQFILNALGFWLGFGGVFVILGLAVSSIAHLLGPEFKLVLPQISGVILIALGGFAFISNHPKFQKYAWVQNLQRTFKVEPKIADNLSFLSSLIIGATFAFGWSPCVGPVLGAVLTLSANGSSLFVSALTLIGFVIGLALPFIVLSFVLIYLGKSTIFSKLNKHSNKIALAFSIFIIIIGLALLLGWYQIFTAEINRALMHGIDFRWLLERV